MATFVRAFGLSCIALVVLMSIPVEMNSKSAAAQTSADCKSSTKYLIDALILRKYALEKKHIATTELAGLKNKTNRTDQENARASALDQTINSVTPQIEELKISIRDWEHRVAVNCDDG